MSNMESLASSRGRKTCIGIGDPIRRFQHEHFQSIYFDQSVACRSPSIVRQILTHFGPSLPLAPIPPSNNGRPAIIQSHPHGVYHSPHLTPQSDHHILPSRSRGLTALNLSPTSEPIVHHGSPAGNPTNERAAGSSTASNTS